jgi:enoyl-CoA hydratase
MTMLSVVREDHLVTLTLNRPDKLNALNDELLGALHAAFDALAEDSARAVIVTGAGKAFSAGVDIEELRTMTPAEARKRAQRGHSLAAKIEALACPVIAAVAGFALGGGCELALACDFIYAAEGAKLGQPEVSLGVIPGFGGTQRLAERVGLSRARELIYTGELVRADRALTMGLVNAVLPPDELLPRVRSVALLIAEKSPLAVAQAKRTMLRGVEAGLTAGCELEAQAFAALFGSEDQKEGMQAFVDKRKPAFLGR